MHITLLEHVKNSTVLVEGQFQFCAKSTTENAIHSLIHVIFKPLHEKSRMWAFSVVFQKLLVVLTTISYCLD